MAPLAGMRRRLLAPEAVQSSAMDCGPAALKCLLEGFRVSVSYGRLREACQTDVDGTSIDTLEQVAGQLGLEAEQVMAPVDHLLLPAADLLPALVVTRQSDGATHFVVAWRRLGPLLQLMDPATGRRWLSCRQFLDEVYIHEFPIAESEWRRWAGSEEESGVFRARLARLGIAGESARRLLQDAGADPGWQALAALDKSVRAVEAIVRAGGLRAGQEAARLLKRSFTRARREAGDGPTPDYWSVRPALPGPAGEPRLMLRGAVLLRVRGACRTPEAASPVPLSPELVAALDEPPSRPGWELLRRLIAHDRLAPAALLMAYLFAAAGVVFEAVLLRGLVDLGGQLVIAGQRLGAMAALLFFATALLLLELPMAAGVLRLGRRLEVRLRREFLEKVPRLGDRYFASRLISDMAERCHSVHRLRLLPEIGGNLARAVFELFLTTAGIAWLAPAALLPALLTTTLAVAIPFAAQSLLAERELRQRTHAGALSRFYLDAFLGLVAIRAHGAERAVRREHEALVVNWAQAGVSLQRVVVAIEGVQFFAGFSLAAWLLFAHLAEGGPPGSVLLLVYWALSLPVLGEEVALIARQYPAERNVAVRLLEPLGAPDDPGEVVGEAALETVVPGVRHSGVAVHLQRVAVRAAGHVILEDIDLDIPSGSHVAIVGPSGAGKSTLVGLLLGWHRPAAGRVVVDEAPLDSSHLERLRRETAWVDPAVQLWNRSLLDNLLYGAGVGGSLPPVSAAIEAAGLYDVIERLPEGLQTRLGEGGALLSGGEGQRVRLARALLRPGVRLVILDEPFRGLDRPQRRMLLARLRRAWAGATLLCITHDISETQTFDRVVVVEGGRLIADGSPADLGAQSGSRYRAMLDAEEAVRSGLWSHREWRCLRLEGGRLADGSV